MAINMPTRMVIGPQIVQPNEHGFFWIFLSVRVWFFLFHIHTSMEYTMQSSDQLHILSHHSTFINLFMFEKSNVKRLPNEHFLAISFDQRIFSFELINMYMKIQAQVPEIIKYYFIFLLNLKLSKQIIHIVN